MEFSISLLKKVIAALLASFGFGMFFKIPPKFLRFAGLGGTLVWLIYTISEEITGSVIIATFIGAIVAAIFSNICSVTKKEPRTTFLIPSIFFLVPGSGIYNTMLGIVYNDMNYTLKYGLETIKVALAIAMGIAVVFVLPVFSKRNTKASTDNREQYPEPGFKDSDEDDDEEDEEREIMLKSIEERLKDQEQTYNETNI